MQWFTVRDSTSADENALVYLWLGSYAWSLLGKSIGANKKASPEELSYWADERPRVMRHLIEDGAKVACDVNDPSIIYGFICITLPDNCAARLPTIHAIVVKYDCIKGGFGLEVLDALLGDLVDKPCAYTTELPDLARVFSKEGVHNRHGIARRVPPQWCFDGSYYFRREYKAQRVAA